MGDIDIMKKRWCSEKQMIPQHMHTVKLGEINA